MGQDQKTDLGASRAVPVVTGQAGKVLNLIRELQPVLSLTLTADHAIPETAARVHGLRCIGFNVLTTIHPAVEFRGEIRRNVASYSLGSPEWPQPGFLPKRSGETANPVLPSDFFESGAKCIRQCADGIAAGIASVPDEEKPIHRRAILRNWRACLELSRAMRMAGGGV